MNSLANSALRVYPHGLTLKAHRVSISGTASVGGKRGAIVSFSVASSRRLREWFVTRDIAGSYKFGLTLTLPFSDECWKGERLAASLKWFKSHWKRFRTEIERKFPDVGVVFRIELQKRQAPHIHAVVYFPSGCNRPPLEVLWMRQVFKHPLDNFNVDGFIHHGVRVDALIQGSSVGYFRYLTDHASKHKREQMGYNGRQWGVLNQGLFTRSPSALLEFESERHEVEFVRAWQRFNRYPVTVGHGKDRIVVKFRRNRRSFGASFVRGGADSVRRLFKMSADIAKWKESIHENP